MLAAAAGLTKGETEPLLADRHPQPDLRSSVRKVPAPRPPDVSTPPPVVASAQGSPPSRMDEATPPSSSPLQGRVRPLAPGRYEIRFTATAETRNKLREAQDLLGHAVPTGEIAEVVDRALTLLVAELRRRKWSTRGKSRVGRETAKGPSSSPDLTDPPPQTEAAVKRYVSARDGGRCRFVSRDGHRCTARRRIEFHHVIPRAAGGPFTPDNIELRCRAHNGHEVDLYFGPGVRRIRGGRPHDSRTYAELVDVWGRSGTSRDLRETPLGTSVAPVATSRGPSPTSVL